MVDTLDRDEVVDAIVDFLNRKGSIGLIVCIDKENGNTFNDLSKKVTVSRNTLSNRISEAEEINILRKISDPDDHGNAVRYDLTHRGDKIYELFSWYGMGNAYSEFKKAKKDMEEGIGFIENVYDPEIHHGFKEFEESLSSDEE